MVKNEVLSVVIFYWIIWSIGKLTCFEIKWKARNVQNNTPKVNFWPNYNTLFSTICQTTGCVLFSFWFKISLENQYIQI